MVCRYVGHLKQRTLKDQMAKDPTEVIRKAVLRMLPRNKLRDVSDMFNNSGLLSSIRNIITRVNEFIFMFGLGYYLVENP